MNTTIVFATQNQGKMREIKSIMSSADITVLSAAEAGISADVCENGSTFEENALIKARAYRCKASLPQAIFLADDSGLEVDYLNREPGIYSARYLGEDTSYHIKNATIIKRLENVPFEQRTARFVCAIAAVLPDGRSITVRETIEGFIDYEEKGEGGFGYDPIFYVEEYHCTTAELDMETKNQISHRGKALRAMRAKLCEEGLIEIS